MRDRSEKKFGHIELDISDLKYYYGESKVNREFVDAEALKSIDIPIVVDKDNNIVDGHHRLCYLKEHGATKVKVLKLNLTFGQTEKWRTADNLIKDFCALTGNDRLPNGFKKLVYTF